MSVRVNSFISAVVSLSVQTELRLCFFKLPGGESPGDPQKGEQVGVGVRVQAASCRRKHTQLTGLQWLSGCVKAVQA